MLPVAAQAPKDALKLAAWARTEVVARLARAAQAVEACLGQVGRLELHSI